MRNGLSKKLGVALTLFAFLFTTSGCFGGFNLTRNVYNYNKRVSDNKWMQELLFLAFTIIPVYGIASLVDALFINSIEFWTGDNPVDVQGGTRRRALNDGTTRLVQTMTATEREKIMTVEEYREGKLVLTSVWRQEVGQPLMTTEVRYPDGRVQTHALTLDADGGATLGSTDDEGRLTTRRIAAAEVRRSTERAHALASGASVTQVASAATRAW